MTRFLTGRLLGLVAVLFVTSLVVFGSVHLAPGDPVSFLLHGRPATPEAVEALRAQYHLDEPLPVQYVQWLGSAVQGEFGRSAQYHQDVSALLGSRMASTLTLIGYAALLVAVIGVLTGIGAALRPGLFDRTVLVGTGVATAMPAFVTAIVLVSLFSVRLGWFPGPGGTPAGFTERLYHLTLPAFALALSFAGLLARVTRSAMLDELGREHVEVARARGVAGAAVVRRHVLRNALGPVVTVGGTMLAGLLISTSIVETAFDVPGLGSLLVQSVTAKDFAVVQAITLLSVAAFAVVNTVVDLLTPILDPRLSLRGEGSS